MIRKALAILLLSSTLNSFPPSNVPGVSKNCSAEEKEFERLAIVTQDEQVRLTILSWKIKACKCRQMITDILPKYTPACIQDPIQSANCNCRAQQNDYDRSLPKLHKLLQRMQKLEEQRKK